MLLKNSTDEKAKAKSDGKQNQVVDDKEPKSLSSIALFATSLPLAAKAIRIAPRYSSKRDKHHFSPHIFLLFFVFFLSQNFVATTLLGETQKLKKEKSVMMFFSFIG